MQLFTKLITAFFLIVGTSCSAQKMVQKTTDVKKLENNKEQFIGKPLKVLLDQIEPKIKLVYGNPENKSPNPVGGTYLKFHFMDRNEIGKTLNKNKKPLGIVVNFELDTKNTHEPLPKGGLDEWTEENTKMYGDMIILNIRVIGVD